VISSSSTAPEIASITIRTRTHPDGSPNEQYTTQHHRRFRNHCVNVSCVPTRSGKKPGRKDGWPCTIFQASGLSSQSAGTARGSIRSPFVSSSKTVMRLFSRASIPLPERKNVTWRLPSGVRALNIQAALSAIRPLRKVRAPGRKGQDLFATLIKSRELSIAERRGATTAQASRALRSACERETCSVDFPRKDCRKLRNIAVSGPALQAYATALEASFKHGLEPPHQTRVYACLASKMIEVGYIRLR
jgi:hypothetical protein